MFTGQELRVSTLAQRLGLRLIHPVADADDARYQLVEAHTMTPIWPGAGAPLSELDDWLQFPWE